MFIYENTILLKDWKINFIIFKDIINKNSRANIITKVLYKISKILKGINHDSKVVIAQLLTNINEAVKKDEYIFNKINK
jgi:hypothetical protein